MRGLETLLSSKALITLHYCVEQNKELYMGSVYKSQEGV